VAIADNDTMMHTKNGQLLADRLPTASVKTMIEAIDDADDHVRGPASGRVIVEYGDYECSSTIRGRLRKMTCWVTQASLGSTSSCLTETGPALACSRVFAETWKAESARVRYVVRRHCSSTA
jgi:hypothetical protein